MKPIDGQFSDGWVRESLRALARISRGVFSSSEAKTKKGARGNRTNGPRRLRGNSKNKAKLVYGRSYSRAKN